MKTNPKIVVTLSLILLGVIGAIITVFMLPNTSDPSPESVELSGYYQNSSGVMNANTRDMITSGEVSEAIVNKDYLLTNDKEGTLTLIRISDKKTLKVIEDKYAYQLKAIGDDFGYLQEVGDAQYVTFLDPETGTSAPLETEHSVITWDAIGTDLSYHLYDTTTLGFAKYDNSLGVTGLTEIEGDIETIGQMFSDGGKNYVWVVANKTENIIYSVETHKDVTSEFPVMKSIDRTKGTLAEITGSYWMVTAPVDGSTNLFSQVWDREGRTVLNLSVIGYTFSGNAVQGNGIIYLPVSYTNGNTPDGLLMMDMDDHTTDFADKLHTYIQ